MTDRPLTVTAAANLAKGATSGPGTGVCRKCDGPKEPHRLNSAKCRACNGGTPTAADRSVAVPEGARSVTLPPEVWAWLDTAATARKTTPDILIQRIVSAFMMKQ